MTIGGDILQARREMRIGERGPWEIDWSPFLGSDTILSSTWTGPSEITNIVESETATGAKGWLTVGPTAVSRQEYRVINTITYGTDPLGTPNRREFHLVIRVG